MANLFLSPGGELIISGDSSDFLVIGANASTHKSPIAPYKTKANASDLNEWICLSVHWDMDSSPSTNKSSIYCNGKILTSFTSKTVSGDVKLSLGDLKNSNTLPLNRTISFFQF